MCLLLVYQHSDKKKVALARFLCDIDFSLKKNRDSTNRVFFNEKSTSRKKRARHFF